jgi:hypothetical protein
MLTHRETIKLLSRAMVNAGSLLLNALGLAMLVFGAGYYGPAKGTRLADLVDALGSYSPFLALGAILAGMYLGAHKAIATERDKTARLQVELDRLNTFDIDAHMVEPLILFSDSAGGRRFVLAPNVHLTNRTQERRAIEVNLRIFPGGIREWRGFYFQCPPMLTAASQVQSAIQGASLLQQPVTFGPQLGLRFDMEPRATVPGCLVFEIIVGRGLPQDLAKLRSVPMFFTFKDHISRTESHVAIDHFFYGPSAGGSGEWPIVEAPLPPV